MEREHVCQCDVAEGRNDILRCGLAEEHRVVLMPDRRAAVLRELKVIGFLTGAALAEAEEIQASLKWSHRARQ
jgi:hypothetical protein